MLVADAVGFRFPGAAVDAVADVTLTMRRGQVTAILGPNGAGKTTLFRLLAGFMRPTSGEVRLDDRALTSIRPAERARLVAVSAQNPERPEAWTGLEVTLMGRVPHLSGRQLENSRDLEIARAALERLDAMELAGRPFGQLSGGEQQRVLLARALCQDTPVVLLDEPTSQLDPKHALTVARVCRELAADGRAVGCVLHDVNLATQLADVVVMLKRGRVVAQGPPRQALTPERLIDVYGVRPALLDHGGRPVVVFHGDG